MLKKLASSCAVLLMLLLLQPAAFSQETGAISVVARDQNGDLITAGIVSVTDEQSKKIASAALSPSAAALIVKLNFGSYILTIQSPGFKTFQTKIEVKNRTPENLEIRLEIENISVDVNVESSERERRMDEATGGYLSEREIAALPESGEDIREELKRRYGDDMLIRIDGDFDGSQIPPREQIASVKVVRNVFDAEFHEPASVIIDIRTKAGASKFGGFVSFSLNDAKLNARNPFDAERRPGQRRTLIMFLSGPLIKKKTSFSFTTFRFGGYNAQRFLGAAAAGATVTPSAADTDTARRLANRMSFSTFGVKHDLSGGHLLNFKYQINDFSFFRLGPFDLPERGSTFSAPRHAFSIAESGTFKKKYLNDLKFEFVREFKKIVAESNAATIIVPEAFNRGGAGLNSRDEATKLKLTDNLMFDAGRHSLKFGAELEYVKLKVFSENNTNGRFFFSSLANYENQTPSQYSQTLGPTDVSVRQTRVSLFAQDYFKLGKNLQFGAGLRYERQSGLMEDDDNFSPRFGFVWSPEKSGKLIIRGGFGVFYQWLDAQTAASILGNGIRQGSNLIIINPGFPDPFSGGSVSQTLPASVSRLADDLVNPQIFAAQTAFDYKLNKTINFEAIYTFKRGLHHFRSRDINAPLGGARPNADFGRIQLLESSGASRENSLELRTNVYYKGVNIYGNYRLAKQTSDFADVFSLPADNYNLRLERGASNSDRRHKFNLSFNFDVWKNLKISPAFNLESGLPYTITTGRDDNRDTVFNDRPIGARRNSERGEWLGQTDVRLQWKLPTKRFGINEKRSINLTANVRNLFNTSNFVNYVGVQTSPFFRKATAAGAARSLDLGFSFGF